VGEDVAAATGLSRSVWPGGSREQPAKNLQMPHQEQMQLRYLQLSSGGELASQLRPLFEPQACPRQSRDKPEPILFERYLFLIVPTSSTKPVLPSIQTTPNRVSNRHLNVKLREHQPC
jgi:hypothetical protein